MLIHEDNQILIYKNEKVDIKVFRGDRIEITLENGEKWVITDWYVDEPTGRRR